MTKFASKLAKAFGVKKASSVSIAMRSCQDVPKFLKKFDSIQKRTSKSTLTLAIMVCLVAIPAAAEVEHLGIISFRSGIELECHTDRHDVRFALEFFPRTPPTNRVSMTLTNRLMTLADLTALPSGRILMGVKTTCHDGEESGISLYTFDIHRAPPPRPSARRVGLLGVTNAVNTTEREMNRRRQSTRALSLPPIPGEPVLTIPSPLPGGTNRSYAEHLDRMAQHYSTARRRSE